MTYDNKVQTNTYRLKDGFMVDVVVNNTAPVATYSAYLYHEQYGVKELMYAMEATQVTYDFFLELVEANAPDYIGEYINDHMEE